MSGSPELQTPDQAPQRPRKRATALKKGCLGALTVALIVVLASVGYTLWSFGNHEYRGEQISARQIRAVERLMDLRFPPSARFIYLNHIGTFDGSVALLKLSVSQSELASLLATSSLAREHLQSDINLCAFNEPPADWDASSARSFQSAQARQKNGVLMVTIANPDSERPTVYLYLMYGNSSAAPE